MVMTMMMMTIIIIVIIIEIITVTKIYASSWDQKRDYDAYQEASYKKQDVYLILFAFITVGYWKQIVGYWHTSALQIRYDLAA